MWLETFEFQYVWKLSNPRDKRELEVQLKNNLLNEESEGPIEEKDFDIAHYERVKLIIIIFKSV